MKINYCIKFVERCLQKVKKAKLDSIENHFESNKQKLT